MDRLIISGNTFNDQSSAIRNFYEKSMDNHDFVKELNVIKASVSETEPLYEAITKLTEALETKNKVTTKSTILKYIGELFSKTFTSVASAGLVEYIKSFLK